MQTSSRSRDARRTEHEQLSAGWWMARLTRSARVKDAKVAGGPRRRNLSLEPSCPALRRQRSSPLQGSPAARRELSSLSMVTLDDVREVALTLPRSYEAVVRGRIKFRVGRIVFLAFSRDEKLMGFG